MRKRVSKKGISVHAISGTHVVLLAMDTSEEARKGLLGFAIYREDHTENEKYWLKGFKTFKEEYDNPVPGSMHSSLFHPFQTFLWGDYSAKPQYDYTYTIRPVYGKPKNLSYGTDIIIRINTENEDNGEHAIFFNRGAIASQYYAKKYRNEVPNVNDIEDPRTIWLSRGLLEAALGFIGQAKNYEYSIKVAAYEFNYRPVLQAFKDASARGVSVEIVYEAGNEKKNGKIVKTATTIDNEKSIKELGIQNLVYKRTKRPAIPHNKFIILEKNNVPLEVWTGSTNFTSSGFLGQTNVGHIVRNRQIASQYRNYWEQLRNDSEPKVLKDWNFQNSPTPISGLPKDQTVPYFSPRKWSKMLKWYCSQIKEAQQTLMFTAAFGVNQDLAPAIAEDKDFLRFLLIEKKISDKVEPILNKEKEIMIARGQTLGNDSIRYKVPGWNLDNWFAKEEHYRKKGHVFYVHTKILMLDVLTDDPKIFTGSANFSYASLMNNDENMLLIRGNTRVADIYLGEFMRLFNHFYFRSIANNLASKGKVDSDKSVHLSETDQWTKKHFKKGNYSYLRRELFK